MALWGNNNNIDNVGLITGFSYDTKVIFGAGTSFGETGSAQVGDIISVGVRSDAGTYYGNVVIVSIAGTQECAIAHTDALVSESIADLSAVTSAAGTSFYVSQLPKYTLWDLQGDRYRNPGSDYDSDCLVYGISTTAINGGLSASYGHTGEGWVGVQTYIDCTGELRVKKEVLVAMSGISTGNHPVYDADPSA